LSGLLSRKIFLGDAWYFNDGPHVLSLELAPDPLASTVSPSRRRPTARISEQEEKEEPAVSKLAYLFPGLSVRDSAFMNAGPAPCELFTLKPWYKLLLNEGPSTEVYKASEPAPMPSVESPFPAFRNIPPLIPTTVRDMSYVAIFPLAGHFGELMHQLPRHLERLFVQLVPRNNILRDPDVMRSIDPQDLWMERNTAYSIVMRELFDQDGDGEDPNEGLNRLALRVFESGDAADREAWRMAVNHVESGGANGWRVEREGVFVREPKQMGPKGAGTPVMSVPLS
jgi:hypothetical protein